MPPEVQQALASEEGKHLHNGAIGGGPQGAASGKGSCSEAPHCIGALHQQVLTGQHSQPQLVLAAQQQVVAPRVQRQALGGLHVALAQHAGPRGVVPHAQSAVAAQRGHQGLAGSHVHGEDAGQGGAGAWACIDAGGAAVRCQGRHAAQHTVVIQGIKVGQVQSKGSGTPHQRQHCAVRGVSAEVSDAGLCIHCCQHTQPWGEGDAASGHEEGPQAQGGAQVTRAGAAAPLLPPILIIHTAASGCASVLQGGNAGAAICCTCRGASASSSSGSPGGPRAGPCCTARARRAGAGHAPHTGCGSPASRGHSGGRAPGLGSTGSAVRLGGAPPGTAGTAAGAGAGASGCLRPTGQCAGCLHLCTGQGIHSVSS